MKTAIAQHHEERWHAEFISVHLDMNDKTFKAWVRKESGELVLVPVQDIQILLCKELAA